MTATISFTTKALSRLPSDFSDVLVKYFGTEQQSPYNYLMQHSHRWSVGKWAKMNSSEHFSAISVD